MDGRADRYLQEVETRESDRRALELAARASTGPFVSSLYPWEYFVTATYDPRKMRGGSERVLGVDVHPKVTSWKARRDASGYMHRLTDRLRRPVAGVFVAEPHKSGSYHLHGLLGLGGASDDDFRVLHGEWFKRHGYVKLEAPRSREDVSAYCGKYMTKDLGELVVSSALVSQASMLARRRVRR